MKSSPFELLVSAFLGAVGVAALAFWIAADAAPELAARVPGTDRPPDSAVPERPAEPVVGTLVPGEGQPADLPGGWPRFRGAAFDAVSTEDDPLRRGFGGSGPETHWSIEVGEGYAAAAVLDGLVYVMDYDRENQADALRCLSLADGREIWRFTYPVVIRRNHGMTRTVPAVTEDYVVGFGPMGHISCLDAQSGQEKWLIDLTEKYNTSVPQWYSGQCPLIDGDRVILAPAGDHLMVALDAESGEEIWASGNPYGWRMTHTSVMPMEVAGRRMFVYAASGGVVGVCAESGEILWSTDAWRITIATCPSPLVLGDGRLFLSGGYNAGAMMLEIREEGDGFAAEVLYRLDAARFGSTHHTPVYYEGHIFGVRERDRQLVCLDLDGNEVWASGAQYRFGMGPYMIADGLILLMDDHALLTIAEATAEAFRPLDQAQILDGFEAWGPMALAGGRLILRDFDTMVCLDMSAP